MTERARTDAERESDAERKSRDASHRSPDLDARDGSVDRAAGTDAFRAAQRHAGNRAVGRVLYRGDGDDRASEPGDRDGNTEPRDGAVPSRSFETPLGRGRPLPPSARSAFEPLFGQDLGDVRVHTDGFGVAAAGAMGVSAFAVGRDVVVRPGSYEPGSEAGRSLLAHEVAHVLQQGRTGRLGGTGRSAAERDADRATQAVERGERAPVRTATDVRVAPQGYTGSHAVSPEELFEILKSWRGHAVQSGAGKVTPERLSGDVPGSKQGLGRGNTTTAIVAVSDPDGDRLMTYAAGMSDGSNHAEVNALRDIEGSIRARGMRRLLRGGHAMVVVDQSVCSACRTELRHFVAEYDLSGVVAYTFTREKLVGSGQASPKTSMRGTTRAYESEPGPMQRQRDFSYGNRFGAAGGEGGPGSGRRPRQGELFPGRRSGESGTREGGTHGETARTRPGSTTGGGTPRLESVGGGSKRQPTLFEDARRVSRQAGSGLTAPPVELHPTARFAKYASTVLEVLSVADAFITFAESLDMATGLAAGEVVLLEKAHESLRRDQQTLQSLEEEYVAYSTQLRALEETTLPDIANSGSLDLIWEAERDLSTIDNELFARRQQLGERLLPRLQAAKRAVIEKRQQVDESLSNWEDMFLLSVTAFSTAPQAKLVAYREDLIKLNAVLSESISTVEAIRSRIAADREFVQTWEDWMYEVYEQTEREQEGEADVPE